MEKFSCENNLYLHITNLMVSLNTSSEKTMVNIPFLRVEPWPNTNIMITPKVF